MNMIRLRNPKSRHNSDKKAFGQNLRLLSRAFFLENGSPLAFVNKRFLKRIGGEILSHF